MPDVSRGDLSSLLVYAARYAIGRHSYAATDVAAWVQRTDLERGCAQAIAIDIDRWLAEVPDGSYREQWTAARDFLCSHDPGIAEAVARERGMA